MNEPIKTNPNSVAEASRPPLGAQIPGYNIIRTPQEALEEERARADRLDAKGVPRVSPTLSGRPDPNTLKVNTEILTDPKNPTISKLSQLPKSDQTDPQVTETPRVHTDPVPPAAQRFSDDRR